MNTNIVLIFEKTDLNMPRNTQNQKYKSLIDNLKIRKISTTKLSSRNWDTC